MPPADLAGIAKFSTTQLTPDQFTIGQFDNLLIGVLREVRIDVSRDRAFENDQVLLRVTWRGDVAIRQPASALPMQSRAVLAIQALRSLVFDPRAFATQLLMQLRAVPRRMSVPPDRAGALRLPAPCRHGFDGAVAASPGVGGARDSRRAR